MIRTHERPLAKIQTERNETAPQVATDFKDLTQPQNSNVATLPNVTETKAVGP